MEAGGGGLPAAWADAESYSVDLCVEPLNRFETYFLNTTADAVALCDEVGDPRVGILWDTFHANVEEKHLGDALRLSARHLKHVHTCENDRGHSGDGSRCLGRCFRGAAGHWV